MAHAGEKFAFEAVGALDLPVTDLELVILRRERLIEMVLHRAHLFFNPPSLRHVADNSDGPHLIRCLNRTQADLDRELRAIFLHPAERETMSHRPRHRVFRIFRTIALMAMAVRRRYQNLHRLADELVPGIS